MAGRVTVDDARMSVSVSDDGDPLGMAVDLLNLDETIDSLQSPHLGISTSLEVTNPNPIKLSVVSIHVSVDLEGFQDVAQGELTAPEGWSVDLAAGETTTVTVNGELPLTEAISGADDVFGLFSGLLSSSPTIVVRGEIVIDTILFPRTIPFEVEAELDTGLPSISLPF